MTKVLITGASGVLGAAIYKAFKAVSGLTVKGLSHSRPTAELEPLDLTDHEKTKAIFSSFAPDWVIHCAAERRPDVADKNPAATKILNGEVPGFLAQLSTGSTSNIKPFTLIYISTDYVFDGTAAPYSTTAPPNPVQLYGETKLAGEQAIQAVLSSEPGQRIVLRVPVLYGPVRVPSDSAVNVLLDIVRDQSGKTYKMDHWATRYPTNVEDIAKYLVALVEKFPNASTRLPPILHFSAAEPYTKYEMCVLLASLHTPPLAHTHIVPDASEPVIPPGGVGRPKDCHLAVDEEWKAAGLQDSLEVGMYVGGFEEWWKAEIGREGR
ncbi:NAD(P)-binding protein [Clavulina sp. PMI_390]|nr:NAD(P)-binding protein [Clavulina sp. PMI_390]